MSRVSGAFLFLSVLSHFFSFLWSQPVPGVYLGSDPDDRNHIHEVKVNDQYFIHTEYTLTPEFIRTRGGYFSIKADSLKVDLEFNSAFSMDSVRTTTYSYSTAEDKLVLNEDKPIVLTPVTQKDQRLDGAWLFATRGPDKGQERRGNDTPRKTLKYLQDGYFQWIAYNTETMQFSGTGGGRYEAIDGGYTEIIQYFSRDNSRVGAELDFKYELNGDDWHHTGTNSRGEPLFEIWARRK
jgi:hypothetical protein